MEKLTSDFFTRDPVDCARELIGSEFHWKGCAGRIVETEAYHSVGDEACHTWFRPSSRNFVETHQSGDAYVYLNYGVHWLFNILVKGPTGNGFVLIRALEPTVGTEEMTRRRNEIRPTLLTAGPGRLTRALGITGDDHGSSFLGSEDRWITRSDFPKILSGPRIGISKATELHWRFGDPDSSHLSKKF